MSKKSYRRDNANIGPQAADCALYRQMKEGPMTMEFSPPTLAEMGHIFWGADWARPLSEMMRITKAEIVAMDANPQTIPLEMEERLHALGMVRMQEIQVMLNQLRESGIRRKP